MPLSRCGCFGNLLMKALRFELLVRNHPSSFSLRSSSVSSGLDLMLPLGFAPAFGHHLRVPVLLLNLKLVLQPVLLLKLSHHLRLPVFLLNL